MLTAENHDCNHMTCTPAHAELNRGVPSKWNHGHAEAREKNSHGDVRHIVWVLFSALELEAAVKTREETSETHKHLAERWVDIEVELALDVVSAELAEVGLVPDNIVGLADPVETRPARKESVNDRRDVLNVLFEELALAAVRSVMLRKRVTRTHKIRWRWQWAPSYTTSAHTSALRCVHLRIRMLLIIVATLVQQLELGLVMVDIRASTVAARYAPARDIFLHMIEREVGLLLVASVVCRGAQVLKLGGAARRRFADVNRGVA
jgi:hypothetical protein